MTEQGRANLEEFADTLLELAQHDRNIVVVTSDSRGSGRLVKFGETLPDQLIEVGIAEQNMIGISAGLASAGKKVVAVSPACFITARALEQIKNDVAYSNNPVKVIGISAGVSYGALGTTHHSLHDFAALRAINNIDIVAPADNVETRAVIKAALTHPHPLYIRFGKKTMPRLHTPDAPFQIGRGLVLKRGTAVTFVASGETVAPTLAAAELLEQEGPLCTVISMHTIKPLDETCLLEAAHHSQALITVEEHSVYGGLGEACAAVLMRNQVTIPFQIVAIPDEYTVTGSQSEIFAHYGISADGLANSARRLLHLERSL
jgi:transketolase